jgi:hypothetical protein
MLRHLILTLLTATFFLSSCNTSLKPEQLYGEWKYVKVESPKNIPPDSVSASQLKEKSPSIQFTKEDSLIIIWGGERLSYGKFKLDGDMIRYTENLADGKTREFPFIVRKITEKELVFETMVAQFSRVTALKIK